MAADRRFKASLLFLAVLAVGVVWLVGLGEATPREPVVIVQTQEVPTGTPEVASQQPKRETLYRNIKLLNGIALKVSQSYMEDIDPEQLTKAGIAGMLNILDPFSVLMEEQFYNRLMETTQGRYEGLGMTIDRRDDTITVVAPIEGTPADRVGLEAGDKIVEIDGHSTAGMSTEDASKRMRGPAGTKVALKIVRVGIPEALEFTVERAVIELKSVPYYGMADPEEKIGYLRLNKFSETTSDELRQALTALNESDLNGLVFDLRGNGGGLLEQAVETAGLFLPPDKLVVYTQGKDPRSQKKYFTSGQPLFAEKPFVVLVDPATASASEIVAGAIQDWDRGLIVGNTTFGKGLVQQIFSLPESEDIKLKLTTAKYYVPSGRCIQKPHMTKKQAEGEEEEDTLREVAPPEMFKTRAGRAVYGGGGIVPDVLVEREMYTPLEVNLLRQSMYFDFALEYTAKHSDIPATFDATDQVLDEFRDYLKRREFTYKTVTEVELDRIKDVLAEDSTKQAIYGKYLAELSGLVNREKEIEFQQDRESIRRTLKGAILNKIYGERGWYEGIVLHDDPYVKKAVQLLRDRGEYKKTLAADHVKAATDN